MLILSQDKEHIYNFKNLEEIYMPYVLYGASNWDIKITTLRGDDYVIGYYKTEERAKEVLQEIIETYKENGTVKIDNVQVENKVVYEMPEK